MFERERASLSKNPEGQQHMLLAERPSHPTQSKTNCTREKGGRAITYLVEIHADLVLRVGAAFHGQVFGRLVDLGCGEGEGGREGEECV